MRLPSLPNRIRHNPVQTLAFLGLNKTNNTRDGEFSDTLGLSSAEYPFIRPITTRTQQTATSPTDIYIWDGDIFVVDGTSLKKNGTSVATVTAGKKQMAVINTKLVVFPDKLYIDLTNDQPTSLITSETYSSAVVTNNSITATGIGNTFHEGDTVDLSGTGITGTRIVVQTGSTENELKFVDDAISGTLSGSLTVQTSVPDLDYICSSNNRIWGVCNADNTVYASALGDPTSFFDYTGESGAYSVAIGSEGDFTGICDYGGAVCIWKEYMLHKILGSYPSEYYMIDVPVYGVQKGSERSLVIINNILYYKGVFGVYQYGGNRPVSISQALGDAIYTGAVAGTDGRKYYICMALNGTYSLYAYDLDHGLWMREEEVQLDAMANNGSDVYYLSDKVTTSGNTTTHTRKIFLIGTTIDSTQQWTCTFCLFTEDIFNRKGYLKLLLRLDMVTGSELDIYVKEDRRAFRQAFHRDATSKCTLTVPIRLGRCDRFEVKFTGVGDVTIRAAGREFVTGSEIN